jgi:hypothetical protein
MAPPKGISIGLAMLWMVCRGPVAMRASMSPADSLRISVYATAGDVLRYLGTPDDSLKVGEVLKPLKVSRLFLEGRRGDEYVSPSRLREVRDFFASRGIECAGGIATVPGRAFGTRQDAALGWLNWESEKTRSDVSWFFTENAPLFDTLIVDDFYCTADTSSLSRSACGDRSWGEYRRDLLVSLIDPVVRRPALAANPGIRLILKYPQWYDRFERFGYDPARMSPRFDEIWVGTEVRDPKTRRMGFVQPTEGYINFRWLAAVAGESKVRGAWFDHIECSARHFVDQAYQSVLAGARELTLFRLGDLMEGHPGDAALAVELTRLSDLAVRVQNQRRDGIAFFKPPSSPADDNLYLADYLSVIGLPLRPEASYPKTARVVFLPVQAASYPDLLRQMRRHLDRGATLILTPALVRSMGESVAQLAGVRVGLKADPQTCTEMRIGEQRIALPTPVEIDGSLASVASRSILDAIVNRQTVPWLTSHASGRGRVFVFNVRTFSEQDYEEAGEWLLAPKERGLSAIPEELANALRSNWLAPLGIRFDAPPGVALYLIGKARCVYSFRPETVRIRLDGRSIILGAHEWVWQDRP